MKFLSIQYWFTHALLVVVCCLVIAGCKKDKTEPVSTEAAKVYVANYVGGSVSIIDAEKQVVVKTLHLGDHSASTMWMPHYIQVAPDGKKVWVTAMTMNGDDAIFVINPTTDDVMKQIAVGTGYGLAHVVFDDASQRAFVTAYNTSQVLVFDAVTYEAVDIINLDAGSAPHGLRYHNGKLYIASFVGESLAVVEVATHDVVKHALGGMATQTAVTPDGKFAFASVQSKKQIARLDLENDSLTLFALPADAKGPVQLYPTPDSKHLYICDQGEMTTSLCSTKLYVMNCENGLVEHSIVTGNAPHGVVIGHDGKFAFVTNALDNTVSVVNTSSHSVAATIPVGGKPNGISFWDATGGMP